MKPIRLTMTAFGPYKQKEVIDFTELGEHRLFSISGNTGAGKTTIFDALCYALYGEASGEERSDPGMLRSHFAEDDVYTAVELTFAIQGRLYRVMRQMAHRKQGNKTATGGSIAFYEITDGQEVPCVDRFHVTDVNAKIEQVIGLDKNQFSQIVMLPQGEFRKLLTSETENKEEILRRIFKTDRYKLMKEALDKKRKALLGAIEQKRSERAIHFRNAGRLPRRENSLFARLEGQAHVNSYQMLEALTEEQHFYETESARLQEQENRLSDFLQQRLEIYHYAKHVNERFAELTQKEQEYERLLEQREYMRQQEERVRLANAANAVLPFEQAHQHAAQAAEQAKADQDNALRRYGQVLEQFRKAEEQYEQEQNKEELREELKEQVRRLDELRPILATLSEKRHAAEATARQLARTKEQLEAAEVMQADCLLQRKQLSQQVQEKDEAVSGMAPKKEELALMRGDAKVFQEYQRLMKAEAEQKAALEAAAQELQGAEERYEALLQRWLNGQAAQLAVHLTAGAPCPVCGSHDHPAPHQAAPHDYADERQLREMQQTKDRARDRFSRLQEQWKGSIEQQRLQLQELQERGYDTGDVSAVYAAFVQKGKQLQAEVAGLEQLEELRQQEKQCLQELESSLEQAMAQKAEQELAYRNLQSEYTEQRLIYEESKRRIPAGLDTMEAWQAQYAHVSSSRAKLEAAWQEAQSVYRQLMEERASVTAKKEAAQRQLEKARIFAAEHHAIFLSKLQEADFSDEQTYRTAKLTPSLCRELEESLRDYHAALHAVGKQVEDMRASLIDKQPQELEVLQQEISGLDQRVKQLQERTRRISTLVEAIRSLHRDIVAIEDEIREEEAEFQELAELYEVIKGDNESRISFERYILIEYLEQIVQAANERLRRMSNGQFYLKRSDRVEKRNRQSGLGLDVYDTYTGQTRDVKTLSGGEKFNASLCLALGMADVIQTFEGGISIETMFIDEGFGSLDEESLMKAIDTLIDLQKSGRLIGVISHVQELKQALPAVLEVTKQKDGCSRTNLIIQQ